MAYEQFNHISKILSANLWLLSKIRSYLTSKHRLLFYNAYIKPHIEYCSVVWCNTSNNNINKINKLQRRACKFILAQDYNGVEASLKQLDILSFNQSVFLNKAKIMFKVYKFINDNIAPSYLQELFHMRDVNMNNTTSNLRSVAQNNYIVPQAKCKIFFLGCNCLEQSSLKYKEFAIFRYIYEKMYQLDERLIVKSSL